MATLCVKKEICGSYGSSKLEAPMDQKINIVTQKCWLYKVMVFDSSIEYKRGGDNIGVNALSRCHEVEPGVMPISTFSSLVLNWVYAIKE